MNCNPRIPAILLCLMLVVIGAPRGLAVAAIHEDAPIQNEVQTLRSAYLILVMADHDYKGHRVRAMHAIEGACDILGTDIRGDGKGHEKQGVSDEQLHQAAQMLQDALGMAQSNHQKKVVNHINRAIEQLNIALSIK